MTYLRGHDVVDPAGAQLALGVDVDAHRLELVARVGHLHHVRARRQVGHHERAVSTAGRITKPLVCLFIGALGRVDS